jgi:hypothetical protein
MSDTLIAATVKTDQENIMAQSQPLRKPQLDDYLGHPVYQTIEVHNTVYVFDRIAVNIDGEFPLDQLNKDELLVKPGLIYRPKS